MSRLDELIQELCPNGVEYKKLSKVIKIERGKQVVKKQLSQDSGFPEKKKKQKNKNPGG